MNKASVDFSKLDQAFQSLKAALDPPAANDRERDGAIQRFEYTFELVWKTGAKVLQTQGITSQSPKGVFREIASLGWINNPEKWFEFLEARNQTSHTYKEDVANAVFSGIPDFVTETEKLLVTLKKIAHE